MTEATQTEATAIESAETVPVTGILEIRDNNSAFLRTAGYLPGPADAHVPPVLVRRHALRPGDELTGQLGPARPEGRGKPAPPPLVAAVGVRPIARGLTRGVSWAPGG